MLFLTRRWIPVAMVAMAIAGVSPSAKADSLDLATLINGGAALNDGSFSYSNFQFLADIGTNPVDLSQVIVQTVTGPSGLDFLGNGQFNLGPSASQSIILQIAFDVATIGDPLQFSAVDLSNGNASVSGQGVIDVFNSISDPVGGSTLATTNAILDPAFGISQPFDSSSLGGAFSNLNFETSLSLFADGNASVSLDSFRVTVAAVPEPTTAGMLFAGSIAMSLVRRRLG